MRWTYCINIDGNGHFIQAGPDEPLFDNEADAQQAMFFALDSVFPDRWEMLDDTQPILKGRLDYVAGYVKALPTPDERAATTVRHSLAVALSSCCQSDHPVIGSTLKMATDHITIALALLDTALAELDLTDTR